MCGNAVRCIGKYVYDNGLTHKTTLTLETLAGVIILQLQIGENNTVEQVTVDMGEPVFESEKIPVNIATPQVINVPVSFSDKVSYNITTVSMGNPHAVIFTEKIDELNLQETGTIIENSPIFPNRINTEFIEPVDSTHIKMRVWERGSGETMACGTGACAAVVAGVLNGINERKTFVQLLGGELLVEWRESNNHVYLTGDAVTVFEGEVLMC